MMAQIESSDQWAYYQAKGIKAAVLDAKMTLGGTPSEQDRAKAEKYQEEQGEIQKEARAKETEAKANFHQHETFAHGVTMFQIAIAVAAIFLRRYSDGRQPIHFVNALEKTNGL